MTSLAQLPNEVAKALLDIEAVSLRPDEPFTWTSGLKSPIYCDNRTTISFPEIRNLIAEGFVQIIREQYPDAEVIAGIATGGIPHAAFVANILGLPMIYIRDKAKGHGKENVIEGIVKEGQRVILIEDLISTGGSSLKAALAVRQAGAIPQAVIAIFTYEFAKSVNAFAQEHIPLQTLSNYSALLQEALARGLIDEDRLPALQSWREKPEAYGI